MREGYTKEAGGVLVMTYEKALEVLGLKGNPTVEEVEFAFRKLVHKYHPDKEPRATDERRAELVKQFQEVNDAHMVAVNHVAPIEYDYLKEYQELRSRVSAFADNDELKAAMRKLAREPTEDPDRIIKLNRARGELLNQYKRYTIKLHKQTKRLGKRVQMTEEQRQKAEEHKQKTRQKFNKDWSEAFHNIRKNLHQGIQHIANSHKIKNNKATIPIEDTINGKPITRYAVLTASLLAAIAAGKYIYDHNKDAFTKPQFGGLLTNKK